jgi:hypothetical protein
MAKANPSGVGGAGGSSGVCQQLYSLRPSEGPTKPMGLFGFAKIVAFLFVELLNSNVPARSVDDTRLALLLPFLDFSMDGLPVQGRAVLLQPPFLELSFILPFAK